MFKNLGTRHHRGISTYVLWFLKQVHCTTATNYNNAHMEQCNRANFQVANLRRKAFSRQAACHICSLIIHKMYELQLMIDRFFSYLKQDSYNTIPMPTVLWRLHVSLFFFSSLHELFLREDGYARYWSYKHATIHRTATPACMCQPLGRFQCPCRPHCYARLVRACSLEIRESDRLQLHCMDY